MTADFPARVIALSTAKLKFLLFASLGFVAAGIWFWLFPEQVRRWHPDVVQVYALIAVAFFGICAVYVALKQRDPGPGLVIDAEGLIDRSSGVAAGRVPWADIKGLTVHEVRGQPFLAVDVHDPQKYVARANPLMRPVVAMNMKLFGSPIQLSAVTLQIEFDELVDAVTQAHAHRSRR